MARMFIPKSSIASAKLNRASTVPGLAMQTHVSRFIRKLSTGSGKKKRQPTIPPTLPPYKHREFDLCPDVKTVDERFPEETYNVEPTSESALDLLFLDGVDNISVYEPMAVDPEDYEMGTEYDDDDIEMYAPPDPKSHSQGIAQSVPLMPSTCPSSSQYFFPPGIASSWAFNPSPNVVPDTFAKQPDRFEVNLPKYKEIKHMQGYTSPASKLTPGNGPLSSLPFPLSVSVMQTPSPTSFRQKMARVARKVKDVAKFERSDNSIQHARSSPYGKDRRPQDQLLSRVDLKTSTKSKSPLKRSELFRWFGVEKSSVKEEKASIAPPVRLGASFMINLEETPKLEETSKFEETTAPEETPHLEEVPKFEDIPKLEVPLEPQLPPSLPLDNEPFTSLYATWLAPCSHLLRLFQ